MALSTHTYSLHHMSMVNDVEIVDEHDGQAPGKTDALPSRAPPPTPGALLVALRPVSVGSRRVVLHARHGVRAVGDAVADGPQRRQLGPGRTRIGIR